MIENSVPRAFEIFADREQFHRAISNLILNAFQAGAMKVSVAADTQGYTTRIEIEDNGPGLAERVREHLFQPFQGSTRVRGSGLGLAITHDLMRGHRAEEELNRTGPDGTAFVLRLPVEERRVRTRFGRSVSNDRPGPPANAAE